MKAMQIMDLNYQTLKPRHREARESLPEEVSLRIHRALSWLKAANEDEHADAKFIFLWIAFNAVYAQEFESGVELSEKRVFRDFLARLLRLDDDDLIYNITWENYTGKVRLFINNQYVSRPFWRFQNGALSEIEWKRQFDGSCRAASRALAMKDTAVFIGILFDRLYMLRNQLIHGGATWESNVNRDQVRDGTRTLEDIVPAIIHIVMDDPEEPWGAPSFPPPGH